MFLPLLPLLQLLRHVWSAFPKTPAATAAPQSRCFCRHRHRCLSPGEALSLHFGLDEATVAVAALVNGRDIHWCDMALPTTWHRLSLEHPALLVVEGLLLGQGDTDVPALTPAEGRLLTLAC